MTTRILSTRIALSALAFPAFFNWAGADLPFYRLDPIGLYDGIHNHPSDGAMNTLIGPFATVVIGGAAQFSSDDGGESYQESGATFWAVTLSNGVTRPLGLIDDGIHGQNMPVGILESGFIIGTALRQTAGIDGGDGSSGWVSNLITGTTAQVGLYDAAHAMPNETPEAVGPVFYSMPIDVNVAGQVIGESLNNSVSDDRLIWESDLFMEGETEGFSAWVADAVTGVSTRYGLTDAAHTMPVLEEGEEVVAQGGFQSSMLVGGITTTGYFAGLSLQFGDQTTTEGGPMVYVGESLWVANANTGKTYQVGLTDADHTSERGTRVGEFAYVSLGGFGTLPKQATDDGIVAGENISYTAGGAEGRSAWMAHHDTDADVYVTTRIGYFGADAGGVYRDADGLEFSGVDQLTATGLIGGYSEMVGGDAGSIWYQSAWVVNAHGGSNTPVQVGLLDSGHLHGSGYHATFIDALTDSGFVAGGSGTFGLDGTELGVSAWVQKVASSIDNDTFAAERIGLYSADHLFDELSEDVPVRSHANNVVERLTQDGLVQGIAYRYADGLDNGQDAWVAYREGAHYTTDQIGLTGGDYEGPVTGARHAEVNQILGNGIVTGYSTRYYTATSTEGDLFPSTSRAAWVATRQPTASYQTTRVGFYDGFHTAASGHRQSAFTHYTESGYVAGYSLHFGTDDADGDTAWVVDTQDGITHQVGLTDSRHTDVNGVKDSGVVGLTETGFAWGYSIRYTDDGLAENGETAWLYSFSDNTLTSFELSVNLLNGYADSYIVGVRDDGLAYGSFEQFDQMTGESLGYQAFGWTASTGVFLFDDLVADGSALPNWESLASIELMSDDGVIVGYLKDGRLFIGTPVPEPSTYAAIAGLAVLGFCLVRRRREAR